MTKDTIRTGVATAQGVSCVTREPGTAEFAMLQNSHSDLSSQGDSARQGMSNAQSGFGSSAEPVPNNGSGQTVSDVPQVMLPAQYTKFTDQTELGHWLMDKYHIRSANELSSCEVCHR